MNPFRQACLSDQRLSKPSLLAMLDSHIDTSKVIVLSSGDIIDVSQMTYLEINRNINDKIWVYYEDRLPRRLLVSNQNWRVSSFNPVSRLVCVQIFTKSGMRVLNFTLPSLSARF